MTTISKPKSRLIFSEAPYVAVLDDHCTTTHCASCFQIPASIFPCPKSCDFAIYCDEKCSNEDSKWHSSECEAYRHFKKNGGKRPAMDFLVRFIARVLIRLSVDNGVVSLSTRFPDFVKPRVYGDLKSHYTDFKKSPTMVKYMDSVTKQFFEFFASTPLKNTPAQTVRDHLCIFRINSFCVTCGQEAVGVGMYLNASRFNHGCQPTGQYTFAGNRIRVSASPSVHPDEYNTEVRFNNLTLDYGSSKFPNVWYYLATNRQRVDSLKSRYFFRCLCQLCVDTKRSVFEERASTRECPQCQLPYVWTKKGRLEAFCSCSDIAGESKPPADIPKPTQDEQRTVATLNGRWEQIMNMADRPPASVIQICAPFYEVAKRFWHPSENLRLAQIVERLAVSYTFPNVASPMSPQDFQFRLECFEMTAAWYERFGWNSLARYYRGHGQKLIQEQTMGEENADGEKIQQ